MTIRFLLKNGKEIDMKCEKFSAENNFGNGMISSYKAEGITENKIIGIDFTEIVAVYRLMIDEENENEGNNGK
jgi:hypothetical protein